jgi:hypothetical protein
VCGQNPEVWGETLLGSPGRPEGTRAGAVLSPLPHPGHSTIPGWGGQWYNALCVEAKH